jgi:hypothetical protein
MSPDLSSNRPQPSDEPKWMENVRKGKTHIYIELSFTAENVDHVIETLRVIASRGCSIDFLEAS